MITFTSRGGHTVYCDVNGTLVAAFPQEPDEKALSLLSAPEDDVNKGVISWPGEYDVDGLAIRGIGHDEGQRVSYVIDDGKVRMAFIATPLHEWTDNELELLGDIDVLCIPADDPKLAQKLIDTVDPRVLIPLPTNDDATFNDVLKAIGAKADDEEKEYKLKGSLPAEGRDVVILKPSK